MVKLDPNSEVSDVHVVLTRFINDVANTFIRLRTLLDEQEAIIQGELNRLTGGIDLKNISDRPHNILTRADGYNTFLEQVKRSLNDFRYPVSLDVMCSIANKNGLVPVQILNARSYVYRRLSEACKKGEIMHIHSEIDGKRYYYLPEWGLTQGEVLKEIGKLQQKV